MKFTGKTTLIRRDSQSEIQALCEELRYFSFQSSDFAILSNQVLSEASPEPPAVDVSLDRPSLRLFTTTGCGGNCIFISLY